MDNAAGAATFLGLTDTPADYVGFGDHVVTVNTIGDALVFTPASSIGTTEFIGLTDTPADYGVGGKPVRSNSTPDALEYHPYGYEVVVALPGTPDANTIYFIDDGSPLNTGRIDWNQPTLTGVVTGGLIESFSSTQIKVNTGTGWIIKTWVDHADPTKSDVSWLENAAFDVTMLDTVGFVVIMIDGLGVIQQTNTGLTETQIRNNIILGYITYESGAITSVNAAPRIVNDASNLLIDYVNYLGNVSDGFNIKPVTGVLSIWMEAGKLFVPGINYFVDTQSPNVKSYVAQGSTEIAEPFDVLFSDGSIYSSAQTIIPQGYESGVTTFTPLAGITATIHYLFRTWDGKLFLQLGQNLYTNGEEARDNMSYDSSIYTYIPYANRLEIRAQIYISDNAVDLDDDPNEAGINNSPGESIGGGTGGGGVETFVELTDTPSSYVGESLKNVRVNVGETDLEFTIPPAEFTTQTTPTAPADLTTTPTTAEVQAILDYAKAIDAALVSAGIFTV